MKHESEISDGRLTAADSGECELFVARDRRSRPLSAAEEHARLRAEGDALTAEIALDAGELDRLIARLLELRRSYDDPDAGRASSRVPPRPRDEDSDAGEFVDGIVDAMGGR